MLANIPSIKINNNELAIHNRVITHGIRRAKFQRQFLLKKIHRYQFFNEEISFFFHYVIFTRIILLLYFRQNHSDIIHTCLIIWKERIASDPFLET